MYLTAPLLGEIRYQALSLWYVLVHGPLSVSARLVACAIIDVRLTIGHLLHLFIVVARYLLHENLTYKYGQPA